MVTKNKVSLELIPRSYDSLLAEACTAATYKEITHINIPELKRFPISSTEAALFLKSEFGSRFQYLPHIIGNELKNGQRKYPGNCLLVSGDDVSDVSLADRETPRLVRLIEGACYVALDQYRGKQLDEVEYLNEKIKRGASGVFTQPYFALRDVVHWNKILSPALDVFYGVSPVTNERSKAYWEIKNKAVFPKDFSLSIEKNVDFAIEVILWAEEEARGVYLMPIRVSVEEYLAGIFRK